MYRIVRASVLYFEKYMKESKGRYELIKPFMLLTDSTLFRKEKETQSDEYLNMCDIIMKMRELYSENNEKYHHFDMLTKELQILGFNISDVASANITTPERLEEQINLLQQFLSFRYNFDEFDNKTGSHDTKTNKFIFVQP